jgi:hypothetical protein
VSKKLFETQSVILVVIVVGYVGLTAYALIAWNSEISSALVTGFALMAQRAVGDFFAWLHAQTPAAGGMGIAETKERGQ